MDNPAAARLYFLMRRDHFRVATKHAEFVRARFKPVKSDPFEARAGRAQDHVNIAAIGYLYHLDQRGSLLHLCLCILKASVQHSQRAVFPEA